MFIHRPGVLHTRVGYLIDRQSLYSLSFQSVTVLYQTMHTKPVNNPPDTEEPACHEVDRTPDWSPKIKLMESQKSKREPEKICVIKMAVNFYPKMHLFVGSLNENGNPEPVHNPSYAAQTSGQNIHETPERPVQVEMMESEYTKGRYSQNNGGPDCFLLKHTQ